ncbi:MAG: hypothetical protein P4M01_00200 [Acidobacteriota bacterium]|nr:hypothetical protein [Acidobacteriota bacterium]
MNMTLPIESVLLVTASTRRDELRSMLHERLHVPIVLAESFAQAAEALAGSQHRAVVLDEALCDLAPEETSYFLARCTEEFPVFIKPAISTAERCATQVELGLQRMEKEKQALLRAMQRQVYAQVNDALTAILICAPLALKTPGLPPEAVRNLDSVVKAAESMHHALSASEVDE